MMRKAMKRDSLGHLGPGGPVKFPGSVYFPGEGFDMLEFVDANLANGRDVFVCYEVKTGDTSYTSAYALVPHGMAQRFVPLVNQYAQFIDINNSQKRLTGSHCQTKRDQS